MKRSGRSIRIRRIIQAAFFILFLYFMLKTVYPGAEHMPLEWFLLIDPLISLVTALSLRQISEQVLFGLPVLILTLLLGRVFCGWLCPLGAVIDATAHPLHSRKPHSRRNDPKAYATFRRYKYYLLVGLLVMAVVVADYHENTDGRSSVGLSLAYLFDPIVIITRSFALGIAAPFQKLLCMLHVDQALSWLAVSDFVLTHPHLAGIIGTFQRGLSVYIDAPGGTPAALVFRLAPIVLVLFIALLALNGLTRRFWCRHICPLGALLGFFSRWTPFRKRVNEHCNQCGLCIRTCRMAAITDDPHIYRTSECVACQECVSICPKHAISYRLGSPALKANPPLDLSRRRVLQAAGVGVASVLLLKSDWGSKRTEAGVLKTSSTGLIRPPGSMPEEQFVAACVRCGECMKICPTNGLQPALGEGGLEALGSPILVPRIGQCNQVCNACAGVCPTSAIQPFTVEEKDHLYMGSAVIDHSLCIAWKEDRVCSICGEACSYAAIYQEDPRTAPGVRPIVDEPKCVGCGMCEKACPIQPQAAIRVYAYGDKRHLSREAQREFLQTSKRSKTPQPVSPYPGVD